MAKGISETPHNYSHSAIHALFTQTPNKPPSLPLLMDVVAMLAERVRESDADETLDRFDKLWQLAAGVIRERRVIDTPRPASIAVSARLTAEVGDVVADDNLPGIATHNKIKTRTLSPPQSSHHYWLVVQLFRTDGSPFIAKAQLLDHPGVEWHRFQLNDAVGSIRNAFVVEANPDAHETLRANHKRELDGSWDKHRPWLPEGSICVSNILPVMKTRE